MNWQDLQDAEAGGNIVIVGLGAGANGSLARGPRPGDVVQFRDQTGQGYETRVEADGTLADPVPSTRLPAGPSKTIPAGNYPDSSSIPNADRASVYAKLLDQSAATLNDPNASAADKAGAYPLYTQALGKLDSGTTADLKGMSTSLQAAAKNNPLVQYAIQAAVQNGLDPNVFVAQINQESGFNPAARGGSGEIGIAQFMPGTAQGLGIDPADPHAALDGAAKLMASYVQQYGDPAKALEAYNAGSGAVDSGNIPASSQDYAKTILAAAGSPASLAGITAASARPTIQTFGGKPYTYDPATGNMVAVPGVAAADTPYQQAETAKLNQDLMPKAQLALQQHEATIDYIKSQLAAGNITVDQANEYQASNNSILQATLQGTTPFELQQAQQKQATDNATIGKDLINQKLQSGAQLASSLMNATQAMLAHNTVGDGGFNPLTYARLLTDQNSGGQATSDLAQKLLQGINPDNAGAATPPPGAGLTPPGGAPNPTPLAALTPPSGIPAVGSVEPLQMPAGGMTDSARLAAQAHPGSGIGITPGVGSAQAQAGGSALGSALLSGLTGGDPNVVQDLLGAPAQGVPAAVG